MLPPPIVPLPKRSWFRGRLAGALIFASSLGALLGACSSSPETAPPGSASVGDAGSGAPIVLTPPPPGAATDRAREGSTIAMASDGKSVIVADEDHSMLRVVALPLGPDAAPKTNKKMPGRPAQVVALGNTLLVTVRALADGNGALFIYDTSGTEWVETARVALPVDAWGIATSPDGRFAAITSAWSAKVSMVDIASGKVAWTRDVPREPRGVLFTGDGNSVYVSHLVGSNLTRIDGVTGDAKVSAVELPAAPARSPAAEKLQASLGYALVANPARDRLYAPRRALGALGMRTWYGNSAVDTLDMVDGKPVAVARGVNARRSFIQPVNQTLDDEQAVFHWWNASVSFVTVNEEVFAQPRAALYRKSQGTLLVVGEGSNSVVELDAEMSDPTLGLVRRYGTGGAPSGIALNSDETVAYVHCRSTDEVVQVLLPEGNGDYVAPPAKRAKLADPNANAEYAEGRKLFYDSRDGHVSGGLGCAGCHPDGRDDGYVWHEVEFKPKEGEPGDTFANFFGTASLARTNIAMWKTSFPPAENASDIGVGYPRQTPVIAGRLKATGPYGWRAENKTLSERLLAGFALHRWGAMDKGSNFPPVRARQLAAFVRDGLVPPPVDPAPLTPEETKGKEIFASEKVGCATCHVPDSDCTNRSIAAFSAFPQRGYAEEKGAVFKTPSLLYVRGSAPYFHDGRFATLEDLIAKNNDQMGKTSHLGDDDKKALIAFLRRL